MTREAALWFAAADLVIPCCWDHARQGYQILPLDSIAHVQLVLAHAAANGLYIDFRSTRINGTVVRLVLFITAPSGPNGHNANNRVDHRARQLPGST